jgi:DNA-binding transcriptional LysR family regulator
MELELRHLRTLCAIGEAGSLSGAAAALGYSQPALTTQLQRIERLLGAALFERDRSGVRPTPYGRDVLVRANDVLVRVDAIRRGPAGATGAPGRPLRLAATNTPILAGLVARIRKALPGQAVTVTSVYSSAAIVELLEDDAVDAAVATDYPGSELRHSDAVAHRGIVTEPTFLALPAGHRLAHRVEVPLAELADEAWFVTPDDGAGWPGVFHAACRAAGFTPGAVHEFLGDRFQLQRMIADGMGIAVVQATLRPEEGVLVKPLAGMPIWCRYVLAWRTARVGNEVADTLHRSCCAAYRDLITRSPHFQSWSARTYKRPRA